MLGNELIRLYEDSGALLEGHFLLRSGMHTDRYLQSALLLSDPQLAARAGEALAALLREDDPEIVIAPALGGVIVGHETARALGVRSLFAERREDRFLLRRGFRLTPGAVVSVVEDVVTTGGSVRKVIDMVEGMNARVVSVGALIDRSDGKVRFPVPFHSIASLSLAVHSPERCPLCRSGLPISRPGSRGTGA